MLEFSQVSNWAKSRVIEILSQEISAETVQMCGVGLASDKVGKGTHITDHNDQSQVNAVIALAPDSLQEYFSDKRGYNTLALTIYSYHIVDEMVETKINELYGQAEQAGSLN